MTNAKKIRLFMLGTIMFLSIIKSSAQIDADPKIVISENLKFGFYSGISFLYKELDKNKNHEFNNHIGQSYAIELSKLVNEEIEIGLAYNNIKMSGSAINPQKEWMAYISDFYPAPIAYSSAVQSFKIIVQYNFHRFYTPKRGYLPINVFMKIGFGMGFVNSDIRYIDAEYRQLADPIYEIGRGKNEILGNSSLISAEFGSEYHLNDRFSFRVQGGAHIINKDFIDGVYNRVNIRESPGIFSMLISTNASIVYHFNYTSKNDMYNEQYPWFEKKFKNLYSKYYKPKKQKTQMINYPWHQRKFKKK